jgi:hypothetical protein
LTDLRRNEATAPSPGRTAPKALRAAIAAALLAALGWLAWLGWQGRQPTWREGSARASPTTGGEAAGAPGAERDTPASSLAASLAATPESGVGTMPLDEEELQRLTPGALEFELALARIDGRRGDAGRIAARLSAMATGAPGASPGDLATLARLAEDLAGSRPSMLDVGDALAERIFGRAATRAQRCAEAARAALMRRRGDWFVSRQGLSCRAALVEHAPPDLATPIGRQWPNPGATAPESAASLAGTLAEIARHRGL